MARLAGLNVSGSSPIFFLAVKYLDLKLASGPLGRTLAAFSFQRHPSFSSSVSRRLGEGTTVTPVSWLSPRKPSGRCRPRIGRRACGSAPCSLGADERPLRRASRTKNRNQSTGSNGGRLYTTRGWPPAPIFEPSSCLESQPRQGKSDNDRSEPRLARKAQTVTLDSSDASRRWYSRYQSAKRCRPSASMTFGLYPVSIASLETSA